MIDLSKFKKVASDKHTTTMRHDDGHELKVVHSVLSPKLRKGIERLPMAEGGEVKDKKAAPPPPPPPSPVDQYEAKKVQDSFNKSLGFADGGDVGDSQEMYYPSEGEPYLRPKGGAKQIKPNFDLPEMGIPQQSPGAQLGQTGLPVSEEIKQEGSMGPAAGEAMVSGLQSLVNQTPQAPAQPPEEEHTGLSVLSGVPKEDALLSKIDQATKPNPDMTGQMQQAAQQNIDQNQKIAQDFRMNKSRIDAEHQALVHDIMNNHISMADYWKQNDKGAAALGALLGGMGSGLTHMANPVPNMIANSQENFLKAEMANMDNPKSLLSAVQAQYGDNKDAADVMRIISNEALGAHMQKVMAPLNSATAQANAAQVQMQLIQNTEALKQQIAMRQALSSGPSNNLDPAKKILLMQRSGMMSDKQYEQSNKELGEAQGAEHLRSNLHDSYEDLNNKLLGGTFSPSDRESAINAFAGQLAKLSDGRFNFQDAQAKINAILPGKFESSETRANKLKRLDAMIDGLKSTPTLDGLGVSVPQSGTVSVISPDGQVGTVPRSNLQKALSAGYKRN